VSGNKKNNKDRSDKATGEAKSYLNALDNDKDKNKDIDSDIEKDKENNINKTKDINISSDKEFKKDVKIVNALASDNNKLEFSGWRFNGDNLEKFRRIAKEYELSQAEIMRYLLIKFVDNF